MRISDWSSDVCSSYLVHLVSGLKLDDVLLARRRNVEQHHAATDAGFEVAIFVQLHVRPEIDELDAGVGRADTVDTPETLEDAHRIPVDVVIHEEIAVLKVLAFGNAVRADEKVNLALARHFLRPLLGAGRSEEH